MRSSAESTELLLDSVHQLLFGSIVQNDGHGDGGAAATSKSPAERGEMHCMSAASPSKMFGSMDMVSGVSKVKK